MEKVKPKEARTLEATWDEAAGFLLSLCALREAGGDGLDSVRAVMHVIRNRVESGDPQFGTGAGAQRWVSVICRRGQFSAMTVLGDPTTVRWPDESEAAARHFMAIFGLANLIFHGEDTDPTKGALFYWNPRTATNKWYRQQVEKGRFVETAKIGGHVFHRLAEKNGGLVR